MSTIIFGCRKPDKEPSFGVEKTDSCALCFRDDFDDRPVVRLLFDLEENVIVDLHFLSSI